MAYWLLIEKTNVPESISIIRLIVSTMSTRSTPYTGGRKVRSLGNLWGFSPLENIVAFTVAAAAILMGVSLFVNKPDATKDVLPFVVGLIGFMGGLVTSMFRQNLGIQARSSAENEPQEPQQREIQTQGFV